jgi:hypothetical protein
MQAAADRPTFRVFRQPTYQGGAMAQVNKDSNITFHSTSSWEMLQVGRLLRRHLAWKTETWFSYAARHSLTWCWAQRCGHGISSICRKATPIPFCFAHCTEALGHPQRSTSSHLAVMPPARGKTVQTLVGMPLPAILPCSITCLYSSKR